MAYHNVYTFFSVHNCLDEDFDAPDVAADREMCRAIVAGRYGVHPDGWGNHAPLTTPPPRFRRPWHPPVGYPGDREEEWKPHTPRPQPQPKPRTPRWHPHTPEWQPSRGELPGHGDLQLTCDVCNRARFHITVEYRGDRPMKVAAIRTMGRTAGWTCIAGTDRCPVCSNALFPAVPPEAIGNGAGKH